MHCYGCGESVAVDERYPDDGLRVARWSRAGGETYCPACARERSLSDPWQLDDAKSPARAAGREEGGDAPPRGPAIDDPRTNEALASYRRRSWYLLAAGAVFLAVVSVAFAVRSANANALLRMGAHTRGVVESDTSERGGGHIVVGYFVGGERRQGVVEVSNVYDYYGGEPVEVIYDRSNPSRIRTPQDANEGRMSGRILFYLLFAAIGSTLAGLGSITRPRRWRKILAAPWQPFNATYIPARGRRSGPGVSLRPLGAPSASAVALRLDATLPRRAGKLAGESVVWVAGDPTSRVVLALPRTRELFAARVPRGYTGRRWRSAQRPQSRRERFALRTYVALIGALAGVGAIVAAADGNWFLALLLTGKATVLLWLVAAGRRKAAS